jgi:hypothetical protein
VKNKDVERPIHINMTFISIGILSYKRGISSNNLFIAMIRKPTEIRTHERLYFVIFVSLIAAKAAINCKRMDSINAT